MKQKKSFSEILVSLEDAAARKVAGKLPAWSGIDIDLPGSLALEQCSSSAAAAYKAGLAKERAGGRLDCVCDITGGLGSDSAAFAAEAGRLLYVERNPRLVEAARKNFRALGLRNVEFRCEEVGPESELPECGLIYADPARRGDTGRKLFRLEDCSPDIGALAPHLLDRAPMLMVKLSPMADISVLLASFGAALREIHVVGLGGEVKELLCLLLRGNRAFDGIFAAELGAADGGSDEIFFFRPREEQSVPLLLAGGLSPGQVLLEPVSCMLKSGAFRLPCVRYGLGKLAPSTHLYIVESSGLPPAGLFRRFMIKEILPLNAASLRELKSRRLRADVSARNIRMDSAELARRLGCVSGSLHVFGCSTACSGNVLLLTERIV